MPDADTPSGGATILVVDDEESVRIVVQRLLKLEGYKVLVARSAEEAQTVWSTHGNEVDLLLTDVTLRQGMNGEELGRLLLAERPTLKVVYSSGHNKDHLAGRLTEGYDFLPKPYMPETLREVIRRRMAAA